MPAGNSKRTLHLPSLAIKEFRGIEDLAIPSLGRVTLFVGKNGVGKTTLLEAVRVYAARGRYRVLAGILRNREELTVGVDEDGEEVTASNWESLFHGRHTVSNPHISIGPLGKRPQLHIETVTLSEEAVARWARRIPDASTDEEMKAVKIEFQGAKQELPFSILNSSAVLLHTRRGLLDSESRLPSEVRCESLGPSLLSNMDLARFWDQVALTDDEARAVQALNLIFDDKVERVAVIGDDRGSRRPYGRRAVAKIKGQDQPVSLKSLGDGATRLFGVTLALANSRDGFLVIDEAENGIHHSVQRDFWRMVLRTAHENHVQVLATTHSWDCAAGFAYAATDVAEVEGILVRLEREQGQIRAVEYSEDDLQIAAQQGIEVR